MQGQMHIGKFWGWLARAILRNRIIILLTIVAMTVFMATQWKYMRFTNTEANLLPDDHPENVVYQKFLKTFGEEGNVILIAIKDSTFYTPKVFNEWNLLSERLNAFPEVVNILSLENLLVLKRDDTNRSFKAEPFIKKDSLFDAKEIEDIKNELFYKLPIYDHLLYNRETGAMLMAVYLDKELVNTPVRKEFIFEDFIPSIKQFQQKTGCQLHVSGMPYIRTLNSQLVIDEIGLFILSALGVTSLIFFFFFRSFRATIISMLIVMIGVMWAFGTLGLLNYEITILTALIPPLIIVIGIPNCIFLINKYQQEIQLHGNQAKSLQRVIAKVGNATLMTNATTASGFATFMFTNSELLKEFGIVASINILAIFILSLLIIPIAYSFMQVPKEKHLKHLTRKWMTGVVNWLEYMVKNKRIAIYSATVVLLIISMIGINRIRLSSSVIEDMPRKAAFFKDIRFFEDEIEGIMPLEILVDTRRRRGVMSLATLKRMNSLQSEIENEKDLSKPVSIVNLVKYAKQAYYNGSAKYYQLPTSQESTFILDYAKNSGASTNLVGGLVDSTGQLARITTFMKDVGIEKMEKIKRDLEENIAREFPPDRYQVDITGRAMVFMKGTRYLVENLVISLILAIVLISIFMAFMFRSVKMILVSLIPNLLPLLITAGIMGFLNIPLKPSTILVFSIAFGISVDDTIHFLAKYRQELRSNHWRIRKSVFAALRETGISMLYTSVVLFFGFSVFMISSFGGTVALGGLVSVTLLFAMTSNLLLLPSLLLALERTIANKEVMKESAIELFPSDEMEDEKE